MNFKDKSANGASVSRGWFRYGGKSFLWRLAIVLLLPLVAMIPIISAFYCVAAGDGDVPPKIANLQAWLNGKPNFWLLNMEGGTLQLGTTSNPMTLMDFLFLWFSPHVASNITQIAEVTLGGLGFFLWRIFQRKQSYNAALLGACTYELCHFALARLSTGHEIVTIQHGVFPWALWLIDRLATGNWFGFVTWFPLLFFQMALSGVPQQTIPLVLMMGLYLLFVARENRFPRIRLVAIWAGGLLLGLLMAAFVYYPGFMFSRFTVPPGSSEYNIQDYKYHISFPWIGLIQFLCPYFFGEDVTMRSYATYFSPENTGSFYEFAVYGGLFSAMVPFLFWREFKRSREMWFWLACGCLLLLVGFGKWGGIYIFLSKLPIMENLRGPARFLIGMPVVLAIFASFGMQAMEAWKQDEIRRIWKRILALCLGLILLSGIYWLIAQYPWQGLLKSGSHLQERLGSILSEQVRPAALINLKQIVLLGVLAIAAAMIGYRSKRRAVMALMAFQILDLLVNGYPLMQRSGGVFRSYTEGPPFSGIIRSLTERDHSRFVDATRQMPPLSSMLDGTQATASYRNLHLRWYLELIYASQGLFGVYDTYNYIHTNFDSPISRLMRVRVALSREPPKSSEWRKICQIDDVGLYERDTIPPPFYFPRSWKVESDPKERLKILTDLHRDPIAECLIEKKLPQKDESVSTAVPSAQRLGETEFQISWNGKPGAILCSDITFYPLWRAFDQHGELETIRVNHGFLGILTRPDSERIDLHFDAREHRIGLILSAVGFGLWLVIVICLASVRWRSIHS